LDDELMLDPMGRRRWLLTKALEIAPLGEALALAQAAEDFISGTAARTGDCPPFEMTQAPAFAVEPKALVTRPKSFSGLPVGSNQPPSKDHQPLMMTTEALADLRSLASIDDVILYLRQGDEFFAEDGSADELLGRANVKRVEQGLPPFALLPTPPANTMRQPGKVISPRRLSARESAEWAKSAIVLPAL
jgi:hypothetical protein